MIDIHNPASIKFFDSDQPYYFLTNFYEEAPIIIDGNKFKTAEHYYQWQKFSDPIMQKRIINAPTARIATDLANQYHYLKVPNFDRITAMKKAVKAKFEQHPELASALKATGQRPLIEHNMHDSFWSDGGDGSGFNMMGRILMEVRSEI